MHKLSEVDLINKNAVCQVCGFVDISVKSNGQRQCLNARRIQRRPKDLNDEKNYKYKSDKGVTKISKNQKNKLIIHLGNCCFICGTTVENGIALDHCHKTGKFRGLLCMSCNTGLGFFKDDLSLLHKAIQYLSESDITDMIETL